MSLRMPLRISPCPIVEAIVEIRFESDLLVEAIFGLLYGVNRDKYPNTEKLSTSSIPQEIYLIDPKLLNKPFYRIWGGDIIIQIGPKMISISNINEYWGWQAFQEEMIRFLGKMKELEFIKRIKQARLRYINFFENDIYSKIKLNIDYNKQPIESVKKYIRLEFVEDHFVQIVQISDSANVQTKNQCIHGSVIDIDTTSIEGNYALDDVEELIRNAHLIEKQRFFGLLSEDFLNSLNPEY